jgi:predicted permease
MPWRPKRREQDLERELRAHIDLEAQERREAGASPTDARNAARRAFGNTTYIGEETRHSWGWTPLGTVFQDLRYGLRQLARTPAFAAIAILTLALGIGANTAIFSAMNAILLRYLPLPNPRQLVYLSSPNQPGRAMQSGDGGTSLPQPMFEELRRQRHVFSDLVAFVPLGFNRVPVRYGALPEEAQVDMVSGNFFTGLGARVSRGRPFAIEDERKHAPVAVLSDAWWASRLARDPSALGQTIYVKGLPFSIVGIAAPGFAGLEHSRPTDIWIPLQDNSALKPWGLAAQAPYTLYGTPDWWCLKTMGRLAPGVTAKQGLAQLNPLFQRIAYGGATPDPKQPPVELHFIPGRGLESANERYQLPLTVLMAMVGLVLLIACANVALLLVARTAGRRREFSLRLALGGSRVRLFRQLLTENVLLAGAGGLLGWIFSLAATRALAIGWRLDFDLAPDRAVLLFTLAVSIAAALVFGLAPLRGVLRIPIGLSLKSSSANASQDRAGLHATHIVIALQMSLCLVLLSGAGLLVKTFRNLEATNLGIRTSGLLVFGVDPRGSVHFGSDARRFFRDVLARLRALPGVEAATLMDNRLGSGWSSNTGSFQLDGKPAGVNAHLRFTHAGPDYFHVLGTPLVLGRDLAESDNEAAPKVVLVNHAFVERYLRNRAPLGHTITIGERGNAYSIIGVASDSKFTGVSEALTPTAYFPLAQSSDDIFRVCQVELRTAGNPLALIPQARRAVAEFGPDLALLQPMTQQAQFDESFAQQRLFGRLGMVFGLLAALLVATGLYGTLSYSVSRRTAEVGVRMALGAQRREVLWMVMRSSLAVWLAGVAIGLPAAIACVRFLRAMLFGVTPGDPLTFAAAVAGILAVALAASFIPARRAASVDPMIALRHD